MLIWRSTYHTPQSADVHAYRIARFPRLIQPSSAFLLMCQSARLFQCALCHRQTLICSHCDRCHRYCSPACSAKARRKSLQRANRKYACSRKGRFNNAQRQKVTDQGSPPIPRPVSLRPWVSTLVLHAFFPAVTRSLSRLCPFCFRQISPFVRSRFLHQQTKHRRR